MDLDALIGRGTLGERIIQQVQDRLVSQLQDRLASNEALSGISETLAGNSDKPPEEVIGTVVGDWLAGMIVSEDPSAMAEKPTVGDRNAERLYYREISNRNALLAAALGACDNCWGTRVDCPVCDGAGTPGWVLPDPQLYATYVHPAVCAFTNTHGSVPALGPKVRTNYRQEST
jgi:hypothetical protein